jgi:hypothetical protein
VADCLLDQRAQPRLHPVERPLLVGEPILGPPVPDRRMAALTTLGHPAEPAVDDGGDTAGIEHLAKP